LTIYFMGLLTLSSPPSADSALSSASDLVDSTLSPLSELKRLDGSSAPDLDPAEDSNWIQLLVCNGLLNTEKSKQ